MTNNQCFDILKIETHYRGGKYEKAYKITSPTKLGYTVSQAEVSGNKTAENEEIKVIYTANTNTKYKVEHYKQSPENNEHTLFETEDKTGTTDTSTEAVAKVYEGFTAGEVVQANINTVIIAVEKELSHKEK